MSISLTNGLLRNQNLIHTLKVLSSCREFKNFETVRRIHTIVKTILPEMANACELYNKLVSVYAKKDAEGNLVGMSGEQDGSFIIPEERADQWKAALKAFDEEVVTLKCKPIQFDKLAACPLSASDLILLEPLLVLD